MATNKARFIITVEDDMAKEIEDYHYDNRYKDRTKAILALLRIGLDHAKVAEPEPAPPESVKVEPKLDLDALLEESSISTDETPPKKKARIPLK
jgi:hypothetical protein